MGTCGSNNKNTKRKYSIKIKSTKRRKGKRKGKVEDINFDIIDTITQKTKQILIKNNATLSELLTLADYNVFGDLDIQLNDFTNITNELNTNLKDIIDTYYPDKILLFY